MITQALEPVVADETCAGLGLWEHSLTDSEETGSDHAAKWETSDMMFLNPDCVEMAALGDAPMNLDMKPPHGIGGLDPREHASAGTGERNVELCAESIARKARELLDSLPESERQFNLEAVSPEHWWMV